MSLGLSSAVTVPDSDVKYEKWPELNGHSTVFRNILAKCTTSENGNGNKTIELVDPDIERASQLRDFVHLLEAGTIPKNLPEYRIRPITLVKLLDKYDCAILKVLYSLYMRQLLRSSPPPSPQPHYIFLSGVVLEDPFSTYSCSSSTTKLERILTHHS